MRTKVKRLLASLLPVIAMAMMGPLWAQSGPLKDLGPGFFSRAYEWNFEGKAYHTQMHFSWDTYSHYQEKVRLYGNYGYYAQEDDGFPVVAGMADHLNAMAQSEGLSAWQKVRFIVSFVQHLDYQTETGEYPKFPVETLAERGGDCEDTSILLAAMLRHLGFDAILISPPGHMAVGLACNNCEGVSYIENGRKYFYVETTGPSFEIGEIPIEFKSTRDKLIALKLPGVVKNWLIQMPGMTGEQQLSYYVREDGTGDLGYTADGEPMMVWTTIRSVWLNGESTTSSPVTKWIPFR